MLSMCAPVLHVMIGQGGLSEAALGSLTDILIMLYNSYYYIICIIYITVCAEIFALCNFRESRQNQISAIIFSRMPENWQLLFFAK